MTPLQQAMKVIDNMIREDDSGSVEWGNDECVADWLQGAEDRMEQLRMISNSIEGLAPGKLVKWPAADGYAWYVVTKVQKQTCTLRMVPYLDAWTSPVVDRDGRALTSVVKEAVEREEAWEQYLKEVT